MKIAIAGLVAFSFAFFTQVVGQDQPTGDDAKGTTKAVTKEIDEPIEFNVWMDVKLEQSQQLLAGLAQGDFPAIAKSAQQLQALSKIEGFVRRGFPGYGTQLRSFEFAVEEIERQAKKESIEGVALGFQQLTLSCVNCHKQLRQPAMDPNEVTAE
ncbi:hypothetical protein [Adhaeretor mobilis]|uniref:Cytochrome c n=1 Tax=Adhaeretor mobilis TaxID=1930276 RepID=A0A517MZE1_9BACT|nr:hypothetical protein [Adhaeretor mobilis]QDT00249.1 hypothetical protein HG15A2_35850 [Adhaeretor mobilis]